MSADGTTIGYRVTGEGPALVVVPGNNRMAHNYDRLAAVLADVFAICVVERRGRGISGPQGERYSLEREVEDLHAVADAMGARMVFGHSYGGLIALTYARSNSDVDRLVVYEPGVSINASFDLSFRGQFRRLLQQRKHVRAMALFLRATGLIPLRFAPYPVCWALAVLMVGHRGEMRDLMPTTPAELDEVARADSDGSGYATITANTLLASGTRSPDYLTRILDSLSGILPHATRLVVNGADHNAPDESAPERIAEELRRFLPH
ncbi:MAG TPA: alpha/beta hydrolase [Humibacter sp.]|nr:alpha/beta hydrolase [Humibacter sp.]